MMKVVTWNVNGFRAVIKNQQTTLKGFLDSFNADIICLQETKTTRSLLSEDIAVCDGYNAYFSFCRIRQGYSGVVTFCRDSVTPVSAEEGITGSTHGGAKDSVGCIANLSNLTEEETTSLDNEGRVVITEHEGVDGVRVAVINVYCPRVDPDNPERLPYKLNFLTAVRERCVSLINNGKEVILCGDFNCALDILDSAYLEEMATFPRESETRNILTEFVSSHFSPTSPSNCILIDSFRYLHPQQTGAYTCWCTKTDSRKLNYGQRIDYIFISQSVCSTLINSSVLQHQYGSDHCPVVSEFTLSLTSSSSLPSLCSSHFSEFAGKQSKLSSFFTKSHVPSTKRTTSDISRKKPVDKQRKLLSLWSDNKIQDKQPEEEKTLDKISFINGSSSGGKLSTEWKGVFKAPPKAPICTGHKEPAVMRIVKKPGPNKNKKFYVCARPDGAKSDPESRCNFFKWSNEKKV